MRILLIAPYLEPYNNPRAIRWSAILREWEKKGWEIDVVTGRHPDGSREHTKHIKYFEPAFPSLSAGRKRISSSVPQSKSRLRFLNQLLLKSWYWPDDAFMWLRAARRIALKLTFDKEYDQLITVSLPFSAHLVGQRVKQKHPDLKWLIDIGDPFSLQPNHPLNNKWLYGIRNRKEEWLVLEMADKICVTNTGCIDLYKQQYPSLSKEKFSVIPPLSTLGPIKRPTNLTRTGRTQIGYFGRFFPGIREPGPLLFLLDQVVQKLNLEVHFFGDTSGLLARGNHIPGVHIHPLIAREELPAKMAEMDFLLSYGNNTSFQLPSKVADYIAVGLPIIHVQQITKCAVSKMLGQHPATLLIDPNEFDIDQVKVFLETWKQKELEEETLNMWRAKVEAGLIAEQYAT